MKILLAVIFGVCLISCSPKPQATIVGKWQQASGPSSAFGLTQAQKSGPGVMTFDFRPDGTLITQGGVEVSAKTVGGKELSQGGSQPVTNRYSLVNEHSLKITFAEGLRFQGRVVTLRVSIAGDRLVLTEITPSGLDLADARGNWILQRVP
ncbi:MAG: hypothetical protein WCO56_07605 [Verrucomicrobiota bacterium]